MEFYHKLSHLPCLPQYVIDEALNAHYKANHSPNIIRSPAIAFNNTEFMANLRKTFPSLTILPGKFKLPCIYALFPANSVYDWHVDSGRYCGINWIIKTNPRALTLFRTRFDHPTDASKKIKEYDGQLSYWKINELTYDLYQPTIIRTDVEHCVVNSYPEDRIVLTLSVFGVSYEEVKDYLCNLNISEY